MDKVSPKLTFAWNETSELGQDTGTPVDDRDDQMPFAFTGRIGRIALDLGNSAVSLEVMTQWMANSPDKSAMRNGRRPASHPPINRPRRCDVEPVLTDRVTRYRIDPGG
ncbi:hypothetical protein AAFN86_26690 [Roseomonas sp. CAU 1739]|uniref:hypothetical protein n=1 Tax=Roseomonas sp. CAU 1739 TaxID=3140364 RepID=UPI00325AEE3F